MERDAQGCTFSIDPLSRKIIRLLLVLQPAVVLGALRLGSTHHAATGAAVACAGLLVSGGTIVWLYARYLAQPLVRARRELEGQAHRLAAELRTEEARLRATRRARDRLANAERRELAEGLRVLQEAHIRSGLAGTPIAQAELPGFTPSLKEFLAGQGIASAADVGALELLSVRGLGDSRSQALLVWRNQVYARLNETKPAALPARRAAALHRTFERQHAANDAAGREAHARRSAAEAGLAQLEPRRRELAAAGFGVFLRQHLTGREGLSRLAAAGLLIGQAGLLACLALGTPSAGGPRAAASGGPTGARPRTLVVVAMARDRPFSPTSPPQPSSTQTVPATATGTPDRRVPTRTPTAGPTRTRRATASPEEATPDATATLPPTGASRPRNTAKPSATLPSAPGGESGPFQELVKLTSPIKPGDAASLTVRTNPGAACSIKVILKSGPSKAKALAPITAGPDGVCTWNWKVSTRTAPGTWSIVVKTGDIEAEYPFVIE